MAAVVQQAQQVPFDSYTPCVAIVTGGTQGIGYAIVHRLADDGFDMAVNDIKAKQKQIDAVVEEMRTKGRRAIAVPGDVSSERDVISMIERTLTELGGLDVMVANAGIAPLKPFLEMTVENFDTVNAVNSRGVFLCLKYAAMQMVKQGRGGRLVAASSIAGKRGAPNCAAYSASKFAVRGIVQCAAAEFRQYGITANAYCPGAIMTPMLKFGLDAGLLEESEAADPEVVASIVSYFTKPEAYFLNGQSITVDGATIRFD